MDSQKFLGWIRLGEVLRMLEIAKVRYYNYHQPDAKNPKH